MLWRVVSSGSETTLRNWGNFALPTRRTAGRSDYRSNCGSPNLEIQPTARDWPRPAITWRYCSLGIRILRTEGLAERWSWQRRQWSLSHNPPGDGEHWAWQSFGSGNG